MSLARWAKSAGRFGLAMAGVSHAGRAVELGPDFKLTHYPREATIDAIIDTGFDGFLTLPASVVADLALPLAGATRAALGDGSEVFLDAFEAVVLWDCDERRVVTLETKGEALVGMAMLSGYRRL